MTAKMARSRAAEKRYINLLTSCGQGDGSDLLRKSNNLRRFVISCCRRGFRGGLEMHSSMSTAETFNSSHPGSISSLTSFPIMKHMSV
jgi:hypothetical protein